MVNSDVQAECSSIQDDIGDLKAEIESLKINIDRNMSTLDRGLSNRVRVQIENGRITQLPSRDDAAILAEADRLRQEINDWQSEINQLKAEHDSLVFHYRSLGCR